ncbi:hypothetical protein BLNAU_21569 [Blattamonas nauphoetae]|uniref:Uncharacterized protein n=1 Tax=Blattamonas nauphoetae TaxID=2049346 RepID=A0ABQ9WVI4_9EUKA|nr:hypothetical protein BLNAU_21569 [Blattamonas nauphoetae]
MSHPQGRPALSQFSICCVEGHIAPADRQRQSARDEEEGSGLSGDVERAKSENAELDATLDAGASDTILSKVKTPHTREMFAVVDEFSTLWDCCRTPGSSELSVNLDRAGHIREPCLSCFPLRISVQPNCADVVGFHSPPFADPDATTAAFRDSLQLNHDVSSHSTGGTEESVRHAGVCHTLARRDCKCGWKQSETKEDEEKERVKKNWDDEEEYIRRKKTIFARDLSRSSEDADKQKSPSRLSHSRSISERMHSKVDCTVPVEHVERVGVTRHGLADELGTADHGERHSEGGQATKDGAGSGGGWREELLWEMRKSRTSSR